MRAFAFALIIAAVLACSCVFTLHPFVTPETAITDPALVGRWSNPANGETWVFALEEEAPVYHITYTCPEGGPGMFAALLTDIDGTRFLQLMPDMDRSDDCGFAGMNDFYRMHFMPMRSFAIVRSTQPALVLAFPDFQEVDGYLEAHPGAVQHEIEDFILLTDEPEQIRSFLADLASQDGMFIDGEPLHKETAMPPPTPEMMY